jgi:hypothetical protein
MAIIFVGIGLAKNVLDVRGVYEHSKPALLRLALARA